MFTVIPNEQVVLRSNGVFKQVDLYTYGDNVFAKWGSGYIGLMKAHNHGTTKPDVCYLPDSLGIAHDFDDRLRMRIKV